jgi:N-acetylglucosamine-6-sulfatase
MAAPAAIVPVPRPEQGCKARHDRFNAQAREGGFDVLFIGDSITQAWETAGKAVWDAEIAPLKAANFGIGGDRTEHVLWRLENGNLEGKINPKKIVLMIGTNNTGHRMDKPADVVAGIEAILSKLTKRFPEAKITLLAIFPRGEKPGDPKRLNNDEINASLAKLDLGANVSFLDISSSFLQPDGTLAKEIMPDFLHLSPEGYARWAKAILPVLK